MARPALTPRHSPSLRIGQQLACSMFSLALLEEEFVPGEMNYELLEKHRALRGKLIDIRSSLDRCECGKCFRGRQVKAAASREFPLPKTIAEAWSGKRRLQEKTINGLLSVGVGPWALRRLPFVDSPSEELFPCEYLTTLVASVHALELHDVRRRARAHIEKPKIVSAINKCVLTRWGPSVSRVIAPPALLVPGLQKYEAKRIDSLPRPKGDRERLKAAMRAQLGGLQFKAKPLWLGRSERAKASIDECLRYMLMLSMDDAIQLRHSGALLRWGVDVVTVAAAAQAHMQCRLSSMEFTKAARRRAKAIESLARVFWDAGTFDKPTLIATIFDDLDIVPSKEGAHSIIRSIQTLASAAALFHHQMKLLSIDPNWFWEAWTIGNAAYPASEWPRLGAATTQPGIYGVREAVTRLMVRESEPPPYLNVTIAPDDVSVKSEQAELTCIAKEAHAKYVLEPTKQAEILLWFESQVEARCPALINEARSEFARLTSCDTSRPRASGVHKSGRSSVRRPAVAHEQSRGKTVPDSSRDRGGPANGKVE